jgi:Flp pilus assembly protein TadD
MLAKKNRIVGGAIIFVALAVFVTGCLPPGPRALLKGKKLLERGDYAAAVEQLKTATTLLPADAQAWNYLGVACQRAGQPTDAANAYQRALALDRDLVEVHYNLGSLWLEQNKPDAAETEFTAYTLRRANEPDGWLKLGSAQLHASEFLAAERSFSTALALSTNNAEALNGLGLARIERGRPREASQFFAAAIEHHHDYAPAYLNLATVAQQELHDDKLALQNYHAYLALTPRPANWDAVNELAKNLEQAAANPPAPPPAVQNQTAAAPPPTKTNAPKPLTIARTTNANKPQTKNLRPAPNPPPRIAYSSSPQIVNVQPEPQIVTTPGKTVVVPKPVPVAPPGNYAETGVTPLTPFGSATSSDANSGLPSKPAQIIQPAPPNFPRYLYLSPRKPRAGNRATASGAFTRAQVFEQDARWTDALEWYRRATLADASWFEAQYNYGVLASRLRNHSASLAAYETALAIQPDSADARYNFALTLKAAGYAFDAVDELKKILAAHPDDVRAQLALGNLYAQQLRDPASARVHYLKVLELDPQNPKATDIRFWLSANPG